MPETLMFEIESSVLGKCGYTAEQLNNAARSIRPDHKFTDFQAFLSAENKYNINAVFMIAHAAVESAWGTSYYARTRNNLFGFNAYDSNPDQASAYASQAGSILFYARFLSENYLTPGGVYYNGTTVHGIFVKYSTSHDQEARTIVGIMNALVAHITNSPRPEVKNAPVPAKAAQSEPTYRVTAGDTLLALSQRWGCSVADIIASNRAKYPNIGQGHNAFLAAGWTIYIPGHSPVPVPVSNTLTITVPSGRNGYLSVLADNYGTTIQQIIEWNKSKYPTIGTGQDSHIEAGWRIRVR